MLVVFLGLGFFGVFLLFEKEYLGLLFLGIGLYYSFDQSKKLRDESPQIVLNDKGIKLKNENLVSWDKILNDLVFSESNGKSSTNCLVFNDEKIAIDELTIEYEELENLLHVYRVRYEKNKLT